MVRGSRITLIVGAIATAFAVGRYTGRPVELPREAADAPSALSRGVLRDSTAAALTAVARENSEVRQAAAAHRLGSPDPATVAGPHGRDRRIVNHLLREIERRGVEPSPETGEGAPSEVTVAAFADAFKAALEERTDR